MTDNCEYEIWLDEPLFSDDGEVTKTIKLPWCKILDKKVLNEMYNINTSIKETDCVHPSKYCSVRDLIEKGKTYTAFFTEKLITENVKK